MQPLAELAFLDVTDKAVDAGDRLGGGAGAIEAQVVLDTARLRLGADIGLKPVAAARIEPPKSKAKTWDCG